MIKEDQIYCLDEYGCVYEIDMSKDVYQMYKLTDKRTFGMVYGEKRKEIYVFSIDGYVYCFDTEYKNTIACQLIRDTAIITASISKNSEELYVADENRNLYLFNLKSKRNQ